MNKYWGRRVGSPLEIIADLCDWARRQSFFFFFFICLWGSWKVGTMFFLVKLLPRKNNSQLILRGSLVRTIAVPFLPQSVLTGAVAA